MIELTRLHEGERFHANEYRVAFTVNDRTHYFHTPYKEAAEHMADALRLHAAIGEHGTVCGHAMCSPDNCEYACVEPSHSHTVELFRS